MLYRLLDWLFWGGFKQRDSDPVALGWGDLVSFFVDLREFLLVLPVGYCVPYTVVSHGQAVLAANEFDDGLWLDWPGFLIIHY